MQPAWGSLRLLFLEEGDKGKETKTPVGLSLQLGDM